jgi:dihydrolipoamide dehydrogenase
MQQAKARKDDIVARLVRGVSRLLQDFGVEVIPGEACLQEPGQVTVAGQLYTARNIIIATGSHNRRLPLPGWDHPSVLDSTGLLALEKVPPRLTVVGGGVIGMEFAGIFQAFGSQVTVLEAADSILNGVDGELVRRFQTYAKKQGLQIVTGATVQNAAAAGDGSLLLTYAAGGKTRALPADCVLSSTGRSPCLDGIDISRLGLEQDTAGFLKTNSRMATNVPGIYAVGDVTGGNLLAHVASEEGILAVEAIAGVKTADLEQAAVPGCIFTFPEIASVGWSEETAQAQHASYRKGKFLYAANGKAMCLGQTDGLIKVLADEADHILGVHILGAHAADLILEAALIVQKRLRIDDVLETIHPHPTLGEIFKEAVLDLRRQSLHQFHR